MLWMSERARLHVSLSALPKHPVRRWMPVLAAGLSLREYASTLMRRLAALIGVLLVAIWALEGHGSGYFWPAWAWLGLCVPVTFDIVGRWAWRHEKGASRRVACVWAVISVASGILIFTWVLTLLLDKVEAFWPGWGLLGLLTAGSGYSLAALHDRVLVARGKRALKARVEMLTRTRREAVDAQAAELRRIERDLHDGAQARLVALTLKLGRAEVKLDDRPEVRSLVREAQKEAESAISELRDLARGIVPPLLADRGLLAAVRALAGRYSLPTTIEADIPATLSPAVEGAAYFVIAEALTNAVKHSGAREAKVTMNGNERVLNVTVADDGCGGANPEGGGLAGLRARVEALDGMLGMESVVGSGTVLRVVLPTTGERRAGSASRRKRLSAVGERIDRSLAQRREGGGREAGVPAAKGGAIAAGGGIVAARGAAATLRGGAAARAETGAVERGG